MVKVAVNGAAGRMGRAVAEAVLLSDMVTLTAAYDNREVAADGAVPIAIQAAGSIDPDGFDVLIDFSTPGGAMAALESCARVHKAAVVGTTGFSNAQLARIKALSATMPLLISPNMSLGMNACFQLIKRLTEALGSEADIEIIEAHHRYKVDAPSGTALRMGEFIADALGVSLNDCAVYGRHGNTGVRSDRTIGFHSIRGGDIFGEHTASFSFAGEEVEIRHKASSRFAFAYGAVRAAVWVARRDAGCYSMENVLEF